MEKDLTNEEVLRQWNDTDGDMDEEGTEWVVAQSGKGDWTQDHKYQNRETVYLNIPSQRYFCICESRSGSYHTDWYYNDPECYEVVPKTISTVVYSIKK